MGGKLAPPLCLTKPSLSMLLPLPPCSIYHDISKPLILPWRLTSWNSVSQAIPVWGARGYNCFINNMNKSCCSDASTTELQKSQGSYISLEYPGGSHMHFSVSPQALNSVAAYTPFVLL